MRTGWIKNDRTDQETYDFADESLAYSYVSVYEGRQDTFHKVQRGAAELSGIQPSLELAMIEAERLIELPIDEFNALAIAELMEDLTSLEKKIQRIAPTTELLRGYHAGFEDGRESIKRMLAEVLA